MTTDENNGNGHDAQLPLPMTPAVNIPTEPTTRKERMRFRQRRPRVVCKICRHIYFFRTNITEKLHPRDMTIEQKVMRVRQHGWRCKDDLKDAVCLDCWRDTTGLTRSKVNDERSLRKVPIIAPPGKGPTPPAPGVHASPPPEPDDTTRRRIHRMLIDVHDGKTGYTGSYTDRVVAETLGVGQAHVEKIRKDWFGPAGNDTILAEVAAIGVKLGELTECCDRLRERLAEVEHKLGVL